MKDIITFVAVVILIPVMIIAVGFGLYFLIGFMDFLFSDPLNLVNSRGSFVEQSKLWNECVNDAKRLFDDFTDTIGASYALQDLPSEGVREFMKYCLDSSKK